MGDEKFIIVGIRKGITKTGGKPYTVLHVVSDFDDYMLQHGCQGQIAQNIYIARDVEVELGEMVSPVYTVGFGGKAIVKDIERVS